MHRSLITCLTCALLLALAACGGDGGGGEDDGTAMVLAMMLMGDGGKAPDAGPEPLFGEDSQAAVVLGQREMPDGPVGVGLDEDPVAGATVAVVVAVPDGYPDIDGVEVCLSDTATPTPGIGAMTAATADGRYHRAALVLPDPLPADARIAVRIEHADGALVESGTADFLLP